jgi:TetR/AcrR family transcriptional repressor of lmrAB and yxaGH operons
MENAVRQQIVDTMSHLLETQGYHGTGLNQIIKESGAPRGSLYYYFPDGKEELAAEAIAQRGHYMAGYAAMTLATRADPVEAIVYFIDRMVDYTQGNHYCGGAPLAAVALETSATSERLREACNAAYTELHRVFLLKLQAGGYPPGRAASLATTILASIEGVVILSRAQQCMTPLIHLRDELRALLECARAPLP